MSLAGTREAGVVADGGGQAERGRDHAARWLLDIAHDRCMAMVLAEEWDAGAALALLGPRAIPDLIATATAAARTLGERWVADTCSFADVTLGLHRLTLLLFAIEALPDHERPRLHGGTVLLASAPGDQHGFGLATVALVLRQSGWDVTVMAGADADALVAAAGRRFDCIGLSVGHDRAVATTARLIGRLRAATRGRTPTIAVGGPMLLRRPDLCREVGADIVAADGYALAELLRPLGIARAA